MILPNSNPRYEGSRKNKKFRGVKMKRTVQKALTLLMLVVTIGGTLSAPVNALADELTKTELSEWKETNQVVEQEATVTEETEPEETDSSVNFVPPTNDLVTLPDSNAPPVEADTADTERTVDELLARNDLFDVVGLTDNEIIKLAKALYGGWAKNDPTFGMTVTNDKGKAITIPFEQSFLRAATAGGLDIVYTNYTYEGYRKSNPAWHIYGTIGKMYMNGKLAFCLDAETPALSGSGYYSSEAFPLTADQLDQVKDIATIGINQANVSDENYAAAQLMIYDVTSWAVTSTNLSDYVARQQTINNNISNYLKTPSFDNQTIDLKVGESITLTDTNNVLDQYINTTKTIDGVEITKNGNKLTLKATSSAKNGMDTLTMWKSVQVGAALCWYKEASQTIGTFEFKDPIPFNLNVNVIATGKFTLKKTSEFSDLGLIAGFKVEMSTGETLELTTDAAGLAKCETDFVAGTTGTVTEVLTPAGYVTIEPVTFTIESGKTIEVAMVNHLQRGTIKGYKQQTILDTTGTKEQGKPVYKKVPLAGAEFDLVAETDILLPDGKTVYVEAGTVVDTVITNEKGYFESTKEFLIGEKNYYRLVETNVPEGYRAPSENQVLFSIPYGKATEKVIVYDLGSIDNELQSGTLKFLKRDSLNFLGIDGAEFTVEMMSGLYAGTYFTFTTIALGNEFELPVGDYRLTEIKLPSGYKFDELTPQVQWVTIKDNETVELNWNNKKLVPRVGISTQAHTGDGKSQTFIWGEDVQFYDDSKLTHEDIPNGTKRGKNVKLHAIYEDGTTAVVWESGITEYTVTDKEMTERVIAEYDYKKDPKATPKTRWYFSEDGCDEDGKKDTEHNPDGTDAKQDITPVLKETVTTKTTKTGSLPTTGERVFVAFTYGGMIIAVIASYLFVMKNRKKA